MNHSKYPVLATLFFPISSFQWSSVFHSVGVGDWEDSSILNGCKAVDKRGNTEGNEQLVVDIISWKPKLL